MPLPQSIRKSIKGQTRKLLVQGQRYDRFDQIRQRHFWSTYLFVPDANGYIGTNQSLFPVFVTPPGQAGQGFAAALTERESNWYSASRVPDNQNLEVTEIGTTLGVATTTMEPDGWEGLIDRMTPSHVANCFLMNTVVSIKYLTNLVQLGMAYDFAQPAGPQDGIECGSNALSPQTSEGWFQTNGFTAPALRRRFKVPILLQHGETFSMSYEIPRAVYIGSKIIYARMDFWATESFAEKS